LRLRARKNLLVISTYRHTDKANKQSWEILYDYLNECDKFELPEGVRVPKRSVVEITQDDWEAGQKEIATTIEGIKKQSYDVTSVTHLVKGDLEVVEGTGEGAEWGRLVHRALEAWGRGKLESLSELTKIWITELGRDKDDIKRLIKTVDTFSKTDLGKRIEASKEKYFEMPFAIQEDNTVVYGVIDVIFKEKDGWVIVDYKTDDFESDPKRKEIYVAQLAKYGECWEKMTQEKTVEKILYQV